MTAATLAADPWAAVPRPADDGSPVPGTNREPGTAAVPGSAPPIPEPENRYVDVAALLNGTLPEPPAPAVLDRSDGHSLFYESQVNWLFGDPECGKTWVCAAAAVEQLQRGHRVVWVDLDHNGPAAVVSRLVALGGPLGALRDPHRFRFTEPDDRTTLMLVVDDTLTWAPSLIVVDSIGELLPLFGVSSNSPDDFTTVHAHVLKPFARSGAAVVAVDHLAKNTDSRSSGPGGTAAKRRTIGGTSIRVTVKDAFTPGSGGAAHLAVNKDRHGGLRAHCPVGDREPYAGTFVLTQVGVELGWSISSPGASSRNPAEMAPADDVAAVADLDPAAATVEDARVRLGWGKQRTARALKAHREATVPGSGTQGAEPGTDRRRAGGGVVTTGGARP